MVSVGAGVCGFINVYTFTFVSLGKENENLVVGFLLGRRVCPREKMPKY